MKGKSIAVIGGGPAALSFCSFIDTLQFDVTIYEQNKALGRKFLVAGKGGFNLTHSEDVQEMLVRYRPRDFLNKAITNFSNADFRDWLLQIGVPTFIGSSKRVFPTKGIKPIQVLKAIETQLHNKGVKINLQQQWQGEQLGDIMVFALGGGSWSVTGSDGKWLKYFSQTLPFRPSNCAFQVDWPSELVPKIAGFPLKNIIAKCGKKTIKGEIMLTSFGVEGGAIYALSGELLKSIEKNGSASLLIDLKKDLTTERIEHLLNNTRTRNTSACLRDELHLSKQALTLLKSLTTKEDFRDSATLANKIKHIELRLTEPAPIDQAISTTGGIKTTDLDENFQLEKKAGHYVIGEMVDWDAPTGGYLLQACFSMGHHLATHLNVGV